MVPNAGFTALIGTSTTQTQVYLLVRHRQQHIIYAQKVQPVPLLVINVPAAGNVTVTVNQTSVVSVRFNWHPNTICNGNSTTLTQTGGSLGTGASWKWYSDASFTIRLN
jgi:hypothetical protein